VKRLVAIALLVLSACSNHSSDVSEDTVAESAGKCAPTPQNPALGLAAVTENFRVHVWTNAESTTPVVLEQLGDIPSESNDGFDLSIVESAAISPKDCSVFVGACCEPVSGITYYRGEKKGEWLQLYGRLPAISPDGELLAIAGYEALTISSTAKPSVVNTTIKLPSADEVWVERVQWISSDEVAITGARKDGIYVWIARTSDGTLREPFRITKDIHQGTGAISAVGIVGTDEIGNIVTQNVTVGENGVEKQFLEYRYLDSFQTFTTTALPDDVVRFRMNLGRTSMTVSNRALSIWFGNADPVQLGAGYTWAG
jgi:hypothetical protein